MKNKKTMKTLVSQNLEFLELELSDEELVSVVGGKQTEGSDERNTVAVTTPLGVGAAVKEPPPGVIIADLRNQTVTVQPAGTN